MIFPEFHELKPKVNGTVEAHRDEMKFEDETETQSKCGLLKWRPKFIQKFNDPRCFVVLICFTLLFMQSSGTYLILMENHVSEELMLTNAEYQLISSLSSLGSIPVFFLVPLVYFLPKDTLWITSAIVISACGHFVTALPGITWKDTNPETAYKVMMFGYFIYGLGSTTFTYLSLHYIDVNSDKKASPIYIGITLAATVFSAVFAAGLAAIAKNGMKPKEEADSPMDKPWWSGLVAAGLGQLLFAPFIALFPSTPKLSKEKGPSTNRKLGDDEDEKLDLKSALITYGRSLKRVLTSPIFVLALISYIFTVAATVGFRSSLMPLWEYVYHQDHNDSIVSVFYGALILLSSMTLVGAAWVITTWEIQVS